MQIENALTSHPSILEAAVISVPDEKYGEVVGAWIKPKAGAKLSRESVRKIVWDGMNPQVGFLPCFLHNFLNATCDVLCRICPHGFGFLVKMVHPMSSRRRQAVRYRSIF